MIGQLKLSKNKGCKDWHHKHLCIFACFLCLFNTANAATIGPWEVVSPRTLNIDESKLNNALNFIAENAGTDGINQTLVLVDNQVIFAGPEVDVMHNVYSVTKSFVSSALGLMIEEGLVSLNTPICEIDAQYCERYPDITLKHLTTMTSGYNADGPNRWQEDSEDWSATPFKQGSALFTAGTAYAYWDEAMIVLAQVLTKVAQESLYDYLDTRLMQPMEIQQWKWWHEPKAIKGIDMNYGPGGIELSAISLAKYGQLFLHKGQWSVDGVVTQLLPEYWVDAATVNQVDLNLPVANTDRSDIDGVGYYGFNWWVNGRNKEGEWQMPNAPQNMYYARGFNNNMLFVIPQWNMVVVRMGLDDEKRINKVAFYDAFFKRLSLAVN